eukprot:8811588-Lingulodinium_polyedra.AAC.1
MACKCDPCFAIRSCSSSPLSGPQSTGPSRAFTTQGADLSSAAPTQRYGNGQPSRPPGSAF